MNAGQCERERGVRNRLSGIPEVTSRSALNLTLHLTFVDDPLSSQH